MNMLLYARCCPGTWHPGWPMWVTQPLGMRPARACLTKCLRQKNGELRVNIVKQCSVILSMPEQHTFVLTVIQRCNQHSQCVPVSPQLPVTAFTVL